MSGFAPQGFPQPPTPHEPLPTKPTRISWLAVASHLSLGLVTLGLAFDEKFAAGRVAFAGDQWRTAFGVAGAFLTFLALRGLYRSISGYTATFTPEYFRRVRIRGALLFLLGVFFLLASQNEAIGERTITFDSWARPAFITAGCYLMLVGLVQQVNPTRNLRMQKLRQGEGVHGVGRILRVHATETTSNDSPMVKVDLEIDVNGRTHEASDRIVMDRAEIARLVPGSTVEVFVHLTDPGVFHVDWKSWKPPAATRSGGLS